MRHLSQHWRLLQAFGHGILDGGFWIELPKIGGAGSIGEIAWLAYDRTDLIDLWNDENLDKLEKESKKCQRKFTQHRYE